MDLDDVKQNMIVALKSLSDDIANIRVGRATTSLIEDIVVPAYGGTQQLRVMELGTMHVVDAQSLSVSPWDKSVIGEIAKAINNSGMGLSAVIDGELIRVQVPVLTEERRLELVKLLNVKIESGKVVLREIRHKKLADIRSAFEDKKLNEDEKFLLEKDLQKVMDDYVAQVESLGEKKEVELKAV